MGTPPVTCAILLMGKTGGLMFAARHESANGFRAEYHPRLRPMQTAGMLDFAAIDSIQEFAHGDIEFFVVFVRAVVDGGFDLGDAFLPQFW